MSRHREPVVFSEDTQVAMQTYLEKLIAHESPVQRQITRDTQAHGLPQIDVRPIEGHFLMWLAKLINAQRIVEIGVLAGYSAVWLAQALPQNGKLIGIELEEKHAQVARRNFEQAGVSHKIEIRVGDAHQVLKTLDGLFDLVFIDAEKEGYNAYLDWALDHVRVGGIIAAHNAFQRGKVFNSHANAPEEETRLMQAFNQRMAAEPRLLTMIFPAGDGTLAGIKLY